MRSWRRGVAGAARRYRRAHSVRRCRARGRAGSGEALRRRERMPDSREGCPGSALRYGAHTAGRFRDRLDRVAQAPAMPLLSFIPVKKDADHCPLDRDAVEIRRQESRRWCRGVMKNWLLHRACPVMGERRTPFGLGRLESPRRAQYAIIVIERADDLQAIGSPALVRPQGMLAAGLAGHIEGIAERRPNRSNAVRSPSR